MTNNEEDKEEGRAGEGFCQKGGLISTGIAIVFFAPMRAMAAGRGWRWPTTRRECHQVPPPDVSGSNGDDAAAGGCTEI